jgi:hypothetical protein
MLGRRFLLLVAVLMGLTALAATIAPREPLIAERSQRATPTPSPTPSPSPSSGDTQRVVERTISADSAPARVTVREGQQVQLTVTGAELDSVSLLDEIEPIEEDSPALFDVLADTPGEYPIELVDSGRRIGTLVVR